MRLAGSLGRIGQRSASAPTPASAYSPEATAYFAAMSVQPDDARKGILDAFISGLVADSLWSKLDWVLAMAAHDEQAGRVNAKNPAKVASAVNSPPFTASVGFASGGTGYLQVGEPWNAAGNNFTRNSATLGVRVAMQINNTNVLTIGNLSDFSSNISVRATGGAESFAIYGGGSATIASTTKLGTRTVSRTTSTAIDFYVNGSNNGTAATASTVPGASNGSILRVNSSYTGDYVGIAFSGSAFTATDALNIHNRIQTLFTAIGLT